MDPRVFYGLKQMPFEKETKYKKPFESGDVMNMTGRLEYLKKVRGIGVFTGGPGTGKTSTIRAFTSSLNPSLYKVIYIQLSTVSVIEFYRILAAELGLEPKHRKSDLYQQIHETIEYLTREKKCVPVIVIDEAQYLRNDVLSDLKLLLNFEMDSKNYCILILAGQSSLNGMLKKHIHEALRQRIVINYDMEGLQKDEMEEYVTYCMKQCGSKEPVFTPEALEAVYGIGNGSVRKMNNILSKCLIEGANMEARTIGSEIVLKAHDEVELN